MKKGAFLALLGLPLSLFGCGSEVDLGDHATTQAGAGGTTVAIEQQQVGIGDPCIFSDERDPTFPGMSASEVVIEARIFKDKNLVCLSNHFRGRVTCPLGQDEALTQQAKDYAEAYAQPPDGMRPSLSDTDRKTLCRPYGALASTAGVVTTQVEPQCVSRQAKDTVYYSCRCGGKYPEADYCNCTAEMACLPIARDDQEDPAIDNGISGSYCVKKSDLTTGPDGQPVLRYQTDECPSPGSDPADACSAASQNCGVTSNAGPF